MEETRSIGVMKLAAGHSGHVHPLHAVEQVCQQVSQTLSGAPDLVMLFLSSHHLEAARAVAYALRRRLQPRCLIGVSAESVVGGDTEYEGVPGLSVFAASLPGVDIHPFKVEDLLRHVGPGADAALAAGAAMTESHRGTILLVDPFSVPLNSLLPALSRVRPAPTAANDGARRAPIIGGMASAARQAGGNVLLLNDKVLRSGGVGVSFSGPIRIDTFVSQGCRPIGQPMVITGGKGQIISSLGGKPALQALSETIESIDEHSKKLLSRGLLIGRVISEYKDRFGRDDFLVRAVLGVEKSHEALAVADLLRVGQTVQFHVRDAETADEDLAMLLDREKLYEPPLGALLFTCNGRGKRLFPKAHHDAAAIARAFSPPPPGEEQARAGVPIPDLRTPMPLAGFFAAGEIGPVGDNVFVHGQSAAVALFRPE